MKVALQNLIFLCREVGVPRNVGTTARTLSRNPTKPPHREAPDTQGGVRGTAPSLHSLAPQGEGVVPCVCGCWRWCDLHGARFHGTGSTNGLYAYNPPGSTAQGVAATVL